MARSNTLLSNCDRLIVTTIKLYLSSATSKEAIPPGQLGDMFETAKNNDLATQDGSQEETHGHQQHGAVVFATQQTSALSKQSTLLNNRGVSPPSSSLPLPALMQQ